MQMHPDLIERLHELRMQEIERKLTVARLIADGAPAPERHPNPIMRERITLLVSALAERIAPRSQSPAGCCEPPCCVACA